MSAGNDDLHGLFERLSRQLTDIKTSLVEIRDEKLEKIIEVVRSGFEEVQDAINRNIQAQAEIKMVEYMMEVEEVEPQIEAERERLEEEREELQERLDQIGERYRSRHDDLDQKARERIRNLGEHIFELEEEQFETGIEGRFVDQVTPSWPRLRDQTADAMAQRRDRVETTVDQTLEDVESFVERQDALIERIDDHRLESPALAPDGDDPEPIQVPYYVVEYEVDGRERRELVVPSETRATSGDDGWCSARLEPLDGAEQLLDRTTGASDFHAVRSEFDGTRRTVRGSDATEVLRDHDQPWLGLSYVDTLEDILDETVEMRVEGGES